MTEFFLDTCGNYVTQVYGQLYPFNRKAFAKEEWISEIVQMWMVSQKDHEYNPIHIHGNCHLSAVMYIKIPEYLPSRKTSQRNEDGVITFSSNSARDFIWGRPTLTIQPSVGDFFIFAASQQHQVYPFRTPDGKGERRSVSFNAVFSSKTDQNLNSQLSRVIE